MSVKRRLPWTWLGVTLGVVFLGSNLLRSAFADDPTKPRPKDQARAERVAVSPTGQDERLSVPEGDFVSGNGVVEPADREVHIAASISGRVAKVLVREGDRIEAGAVVVELENSVELAALDAAGADVRTAEAELTRVLHGNRKEDVQAALAEAEAATARAGLSAGVAERLSKAAEGGGATPDDVDRATRQAQADKASAALADARKRASVAGSRMEDVVAARARVLAAESRRGQAKAALELRSVRSACAGEVLQVKVRAGEFYQAGASDPLVVVGDTRQLRVRMDVDERDLAKVVVGAQAIARATAYPGVDFLGKVVELGRRMGRKNVRTDDPVERNDTKVLEVLVALERPERLVVGQRVTAYVASTKAP